MKLFNFFLYLIIIIKLIIQSLSYEFIYEPYEVINYINKEEINKEDFESIIDYLIGIFNDAYAFNEISLNPPQPSFNNNYHEKVDIITEFLNIKGNLNDDTKVYDFYREIILSISKLKDCHIQINWNILKREEFYLFSPIEFIIRETEDGIPQLFANCLVEEFSDCIACENIDEVFDVYNENDEIPIKSINDKNPFDFINDFGNNFLSTKNEHSTFSFKMKFHNDLDLSDYPFSIEDFPQLDIEFESEAHIYTKYYIGSDIDIENNDNERRNLNMENKSKNKKRKNTNNKSKKRNLHNIINWYHKTKDDTFKCYEDTINNINVYYISSFAPEDQKDFMKAFEDCYKHFDKNEYPILVINDVNEGGSVYLSQLFLGIISPLMPIDLYKGRIRISESFKETEEIKNYIETYLTSSENCLHTNYDRLTSQSQRVQVKYTEDISMDLTQIFFINNITTHNYIENARKNMEHKRKPTDILIFTDGYSFSAASLFIQYLQRIGGGIVTSYLGNPNRKDKFFDISQSPSPLFSHNMLKIFSPDNYNNLLKMRIKEEDENSWTMQIPGIQSFYDIEDYNNSLEYEVIDADINSDIYVNFDEEIYDRFINRANEILELYKNECNPDNKNLIKISEECDNKFGNKYTHGGYECGKNKQWNKVCVASYCDPGYLFNKKKKKCIRDICSSIPIEIDDGSKHNNDNKKSVYGTKIFLKMIVIFTFIFLIIMN